MVATEGIDRISTRDLWTFIAPALQIVWINILLSGDNAVVIALACRNLGARQRRLAIAAGSGVAVALRIGLTFFIVALDDLPYVKLLSGLLLFWIAFDMLRAHDDKTVQAAGSLWTAVRTIAIADAIMSLDNVVAVAAAAKNSVPLIVFGIALSVPLIVFGSTLILSLLRRFPILVIAGSALLGWVAGEITAAEPIVKSVLATYVEDVELVLKVAGATLMLVAAAVVWFVRRRGNAHDRAAVAGEAPDRKPAG